MEFTDISGVLTTTVSNDMVTDAEFDVLWEGNKTRFFTHGAWPGFSRDPNENFYADNIEDAKVKFKEYLNGVVLKLPNFPIIQNYEAVSYNETEMI